MNYLSAEQLNVMSFPDAPISGFNLDLEKNELRFFSDAFVGKGANGHWLNNVDVTIERFHSLKILEEEKREILKYTDEFALREICEFAVSENTIVMKGFSIGRGLWTEFLFSGGVLNVRYEESNK